MRVQEFMLFMFLIGCSIITMIVILVMDQIWPEIKKNWSDDDADWSSEDSH